MGRQCFLRPEAPGRWKPPFSTERTLLKVLPLRLGWRPNCLIFDPWSFWGWVLWVQAGAPRGNVCLPAVVGEGRPCESSRSGAGALLQLPVSLVFTWGFYREFKAYLPVALAAKAYQVSVQKGRTAFAKIKTKWLSNFHQRRTYSHNCTVYLACFHKTF